MKVYRALLFLCLGGAYFLVDCPAYSSPLKSDSGQMELYLEKLQANIIEEEKAVESLRNKYDDILSNKQSPKEQNVRKENKELIALQSEKIAAEAKLKDLEVRQQALQQKNQELLNSLEQSKASIQKKDKAIEEFKKQEDILKRRQVRREEDEQKEENKELIALQSEKIAAEAKLKDLEVRQQALQQKNQELLNFLEQSKASIQKKDKAIEEFKRQEDILKRRQVRREEDEQKEENKELIALQSEKIAAEAKLKDLEVRQQALQQKNQELLNFLEQSKASIQKKDKAIEELKNRRTSRPKEEILSPQSSREGNHSEEDAAVRKQLDKLYKEKVSLEGQLEAMKEERKIRSARDTVHPATRAYKKVNEKQKKEIKKNSSSRESVDSKSLGKNRASYSELNRKNKPGILKGLLDKAKKLDSWCSEKAW